MARLAEAAEGRPALRARSWPDRVFAWRDALVASPGFQRWAGRFPLTRPIARRQSRRLFDLCAGFVYAQTLAAAIETRLLETLRDGPLTADELSSRLALPAAAARALLDGASALGLVERRGRGRFGLGLLGAATLGQPGLVAMVRHHRALYADLADPVALLRRGGGGGALSRFWPYAEGRDESCGDAGPYSRLMSSSNSFVADQVLAAYRLDRHRRLLDIGGGDGAFASAALRQAPRLEAVVFDLPEVAALARERFAREGLAGRASAEGGSFLHDPLPANADLATLIRVLHDHDDDAALTLLRRIRAALPDEGKLLIAEPMAGPSAEARSVGAYFSLYLLAMGSGRPRRPDEIEALLREAGFGEIRFLRASNPLLGRIVTAKPRPNSVTTT